MKRNRFDAIVDETSSSSPLVEYERPTKMARSNEYLSTSENNHYQLEWKEIPFGKDTIVEVFEDFKGAHNFTTGADLASTEFYIYNETGEFVNLGSVEAIPGGVSRILSYAQSSDCSIKSKTYFKTDDKVSMRFRVRAFQVTGTDKLYQYFGMFEKDFVEWSKSSGDAPTGEGIYVVIDSDLGILFRHGFREVEGFLTGRTDYTPDTPQLHPNGEWSTYEIVLNKTLGKVDLYIDGIHYSGGDIDLQNSTWDVRFGVIKQDPNTVTGSDIDYLYLKAGR